MTDAEISSDRTDRFLPFMLVLFVGSGCSALIYEIVWFQMLQLVIGSSAISLGVLLGTFMGGMCLGSLLFPYLVSRKRHPLRVYAILELLIGLLAILLLVLLPRISEMYSSSFGGGIAFRAFVAFIALLAPTVLMGATLPAIARWMETTPTGVARLGLFYGANIAGAVFGCLLAGFYLLRVFDVQTATITGFAINLLVFGLAIALSTKAVYRPKENAQLPSDGATKPIGAWSVYIAIGLSGFCALGAEVVWTRIQSLLLGATVYTFSIILAVFLVGLGIGSAFGSWLASTSKRPREALGTCQLFVAIAIAWTAYVLTQSLPYWPIDVGLGSTPWNSFQLDFVRSAWAVLPASFLWGASFPLALAAASRIDLDPGRLVGRVYAANTVGAIAGALLFSVFVIPQFGTLRAQQFLIVGAAFSSIIMLAPWWIERKSSQADNQPLNHRAIGVMGFLRFPVIAIVAGLCVWSIAKVPDGLIGFGRNLPTYLPPEGEMPTFIYSGEGMNASIAVSVWNDETRNFHVSGKVVASSDPVDMKLQRMLGHLPAMIHPDPKSVLIVGCGAGVTAGSFVPYPGINRIVICEIEPLIPIAANEFFGLENHNVTDDPRVEIVYDDARHFIATTHEKFDIITSDPIHPWVKGAAALYSLEYYELCKKRLNENGIITQWVPLYESNEQAVKSQITTFMRSYPEGTIWGNMSGSGGYDVVLLGTIKPTRINIANINRRFQDDQYAAVVKSMIDVDLGSPLQLLAVYAGQGKHLDGWLDDQYINRDVNFRLQYLAGISLNSYQERKIYKSLLEHKKFPDNLLQSASEPFKSELARAIKTPRRLP